MSSTPSNYFVLVDCNNFYVSCERVFNPGLEGKPVIVLSSNDGCVVSRSQEAKQLAIPMGAPFFKIRDLCRAQNVQVYSSNYELYGDISQRIMRILSDHCPDLEIYSIDEAFLTFSMDPQELVSYCTWLKAKIKKWVGIPVSMGLSTTKTLAKMAAAIAKKNREIGLFDATAPSTQEEALKTFGIEEVWGIGRNLSAQLKALGIRTAFAFKNREPSFIRKQMGVVGERILLELSGISCLHLEEPASKKSITCSRSFGMRVTQETDLAEAMATFVHTACVKLRDQKSVATAIHVYIESVVDILPGTRKQHSLIIPFPSPTNDTPVMIGLAKKAIKQLFHPGLIYKKCGVTLLDLMDETKIATDFLSEPINPKRQRAMRAMDTLNDRFGKNVIFYGAMGIRPRWKPTADQRSASYTSKWNDLPTVR